MNIPITFNSSLSFCEFVKENKNLEAFFKSFNGRASKYTTTVDELYSTFILIDKKLKSIHLDSDSDRKGTHFIYYSGHKLPNSYGYSKIVNRIQFEFNGKNWNISNIEKINRGPSFKGGIKEIGISPKNREIANRNFFKNLDKVLNNPQ